MNDTLKFILASGGCLGELAPEHDTRFSESVKERVRRPRSESLAKHFGAALGYVMRNMEKARA